MVANSKPTRNSDHRHAQSIGRQRQAAQRAAADISPQDLADILPQEASPLLPDAAPVTTPADEAPAAMPRPSWRDRGQSTPTGAAPGDIHEGNAGSEARRIVMKDDEIP